MHEEASADGTNPTGHRLQVGDPADEYEPTGQCTHRKLTEKLPAGHGVQDADPPTEEYPGEHDKHAPPPYE